MEKTKIDQMNVLANTINQKTKAAIENAMYGTGIALGTKTANGVLVDGQKNEFTGSDCMIIEHIVHIYETKSTLGHESHSHTFDLNDIATGDRLLVAILNTTCVIIGKVI